MITKREMELICVCAQRNCLNTGTARQMILVTYDDYYKNRYCSWDCLAIAAQKKIKTLANTKLDRSVPHDQA